MELRIESIPIMLDYLSKSHTESTDTNALRAILHHRDYQFEARRYGLPSVEPLVAYFSRLKSIGRTEIPDLCEDRKNALREKHDRWLDCSSDPQKYYDRYERVKKLLCEETLSSLQQKLSSAFPKPVPLDDAGVVSTLSFGPSFGYVYENALHLDLFGIEEVCTIAELPYVILHELHHLMIQKLIGNYTAFTKHFSMLDEYIFRFTGEGLAIKFCNNAEGILSKKVDRLLQANIGTPAIPVLNRHFAEHFALFNETIERIYRGNIAAEEINEQFRAFWWNPYLYSDEVPFLAQTPIYSFGNELFGCIFDAFGLDVLFDCFYHPTKAISFFNRVNCGYVLAERS